MKILFFYKHLVFSILIIFFTGCGGVALFNQVQQSYYNQLGDYYFDNKDYATAFSKYKEGSIEGSAYSYYKLYVMYLRGYGVSQDSKLAYTMLEESAKRQYAPAEVRLANKLIFTTKQNRDMNRGLALLNSAAMKEYKYAYSDLYVIYRYGIGVKKDLSKALQYFRLAKANGLKVVGESSIQKTYYSKRLTIQIQSGLKKMGFYQGTIDGISGPMTQQAIREFQKSNGYEINGNLTQETLYQINKTLR